MATFKFLVTTPKGEFLNEEVERVILRTTEGDMGILANHAPLVAEVAIGELRVKDASGNVEKYFVAGGFLEISRERTIILADEAMKAEEIDIEKARKEAEIAEEKLKKLKEDRDIAVTQRALQEALTKVKIAQH